MVIAEQSAETALLYLNDREHASPTFAFPNSKHFPKFQNIPIAMPPHIDDADLREFNHQYNHAHNVNDRYIFWYDYLEWICPPRLIPKAVPDISRGQRKELHLVLEDADHVMFSGLIHRLTDRDETEEVAGDEAYTRVGDTEPSWAHFRFFTAGDTICFFKGSMHDGSWDFRAEFHPIRQARELREYLAGFLI
ncbi:hypothetical protein ACLMJK_005532 [Lecanora helva]